MLFNKKMSLWLWLWNHDEIHQAKGCKSVSLWLCECTCEHVVQGHSMYVYGCTWRWGNKVWLVSEWVSVWINSMCDGLTTLCKSCWFSAKGHLCNFPWPSWGCECDSEQFPLCKMAVFFFNVLYLWTCVFVSVYTVYLYVKDSADQKTVVWMYTFDNIFHCRLFEFLLVCRLWSLLHFVQEVKLNEIKNIKMTKKTTAEWNM